MHSASKAAITRYTGSLIAKTDRYGRLLISESAKVEYAIVPTQFVNSVTKNTVKKLNRLENALLKSPGNNPIITDVGASSGFQPYGEKTVAPIISAIKPTTAPSIGPNQSDTKITGTFPRLIRKVCGSIVIDKSLVNTMLIAAINPRKTMRFVLNFFIKKYTSLLFRHLQQNSKKGVFRTLTYILLQRDARSVPQTNAVNGFSFVRQLPVRSTLNAQIPTLRESMINHSRCFVNMQNI